MAIRFPITAGCRHSLLFSVLKRIHSSSRSDKRFGLRLGSDLPWSPTNTGLPPSPVRCAFEKPDTVFFNVFACAYYYLYFIVYLSYNCQGDWVKKVSLLETVRADPFRLRKPAGFRCWSVYPAYIRLRQKTCRVLPCWFIASSSSSLQVPFRSRLRLIVSSKI